MLQKAIEEAQEETGIEKVLPVSSEIISIDVLPVQAHSKNGKEIKAHIHYNITYGLLASDKEPLTVNALCQGSDIRQLFQKALIIAFYSFHSSLLQHNLRLPTPAVDGNLLRVCSRITENFADVLENRTKKELQEHA
mgnify:CR=1 FL=1